MDIEPETGVPVKPNYVFQINVLVEPSVQFANSKPILLPVALVRGILKDLTQKQFDKLFGDLVTARKLKSAIPWVFGVAMMLFLVFAIVNAVLFFVFY